MKRLAATLLLTIGFAAAALAQSFPSRPLTLVVPFPPGGSTDAAARIMAERMRIPLGQPIVIENVGGPGDDGSHRRHGGSPGRAGCGCAAANPRWQDQGAC